MTEPIGNPPPPAADAPTSAAAEAYNAAAAAPPPEVVDPDTPESWGEALAMLLGARLELIKIESRDAVKYGAARVICAVLAGVAALFLWALLLAGGIGALASGTGWGWYWITLAVAGLHLLAIVILLLIVKKKVPTAFPVTRAEFEKDREWLEQLKSQKSNN